MKIIAVGKNYREHALEFDGTGDKPAVPIIFMKPDSAIIKNGKHFYVYSLDDLEQKLRVTLLRGYEAIDVYPFYSEDGNVLYVPVERYIYTDKKKEIGY